MTERKPPERSLADVLADVAVQDDVDEWKSMSDTKRERQLAEMGYDAAKTKARVQAAIAQAAGPRAKAAPKVVPFPSHKVVGSMIVTLLVAAAVVLVVIRERANNVAGPRPDAVPREVPRPPPGPPPPSIDAGDASSSVGATAPAD